MRGSFSKTNMKLLFIISPYPTEWTFAKYLIEYPRSYSRLETKRVAANDIPNIYRVPTLPGTHFLLTGKLNGSVVV